MRQLQRHITEQTEERKMRLRSINASGQVKCSPAQSFHRPMAAIALLVSVGLTTLSQPASAYLEA